MSLQEIKDIEDSLTRIRKVSKILHTTLKVLFVLACVMGGLFVALFSLTVFLPDLIPGEISMGASSLISLLVFVLVTISILKISADMFGDISKGKSPFSMDQVKRLRWIAYILIADMVLSIVLTPGFLWQSGDFSIGHGELPDSGNTIIPINLAELFASIAFLCVALVLKYGVLLQRLSDETL